MNRHLLMLLPLLALLSLVAAQSVSSIGAHEISLPPSFPEEFTAEDLALSGVFAKISEQVSTEEFRDLCSQPDSVEKIVARVEPVLDKIELTGCDKLEEYLDKCTQASKQCEKLKGEKEGKSGDEYTFYCPPDETKLRAACESRIAEMKQRSNVAQQSTESCESQWEKIQSYAVKTCSETQEAPPSTTAEGTAPEITPTTITACPATLNEGWEEKCRSFGGSPMMKTVGACTVQSCELPQVEQTRGNAQSQTSPTSAELPVTTIVTSNASSSSESTPYSAPAENSTYRAAGAGYSVAPFSGFVTLVAAGGVEAEVEKVERFGTTVYQKNDFCNRDSFIAQCKQQLQAAAISTFDDQNVESICDREVKANLPQFEKFCSQREANAFGKCVSQTEQGCAKVRQALGICKSQLLTKEKILEVLRKKTALGCKRMQLMQREGSDPLVRTTEVLASVSDNKLLSEAANSESEKLTETKSDIDKVKAGDRDVVIALTKLIGLQGAREREAAEQKRQAAERLGATIASLREIAGQIGDSTQKAQLEAQITALEEQQRLWLAEADNQEKFADGIISIVKSLFGGAS